MTTARTLRSGMLTLALCAVPLLAGARVDAPRAVGMDLPVASAPGLLRQAGPMLAGASRGTMRASIPWAVPTNVTTASGRRRTISLATATPG